MDGSLARPSGFQLQTRCLWACYNEGSCISGGSSDGEVSGEVSGENGVVTLYSRLRLSLSSIRVGKVLLCLSRRGVHIDEPRVYL